MNKLYFGVKSILQPEAVVVFPDHNTQSSLHPCPFTVGTLLLSFVIF